jgi:hypothetical protein
MRAVQNAPGTTVLDFDVDGCIFGIEVLDESKPDVAGARRGTATRP